MIDRSLKNVAVEFPPEIKNIATPLVFLIGMEDFLKKNFGSHYYNKATGVAMNLVIKNDSNKSSRNKRKEISEKNVSEKIGILKSNWMNKQVNLNPSGLIIS
jgi:hypothetical protein